MGLQRSKIKDFGNQLGSSAASIIENSNGTDKIMVTGVTFKNTNTSNETVDMWVVPDNGSGGPTTAADTHSVLTATLSPGETLIFEFPPGGVLLTDDGDAIQAKSTNASKVTYLVHGDKIT